MFHIKLDNAKIENISIKNKNIKTFLFLYFLIINGSPLFLLIFILHFVFLTNFLILLKSSIDIFVYILLLFTFFVLHKRICSFAQMFKNLSIKNPSNSICTYPIKKSIPLLKNIKSPTFKVYIFNFTCYFYIVICNLV